ncbi:MAG TPA: hypothetical protein VGC30_11025 [Dokdonella sp.]
MRVPADLVLERLQRRARQSGRRLAPECVRWSALATAAALLGALVAWLSGELRASPDALAAPLHDHADALVPVACGD